MVQEEDSAAKKLTRPPYVGNSAASVRAGVWSGVGAGIGCVKSGEIVEAAVVVGG